MSKISQLIAELCPQGVEFIAAGEIAEIGTGSSDRKDAVEEGGFPFFVRSKTVMRHSTYEYDETAIIIPGEGGVGDIFHFVSGKYALHQRAYRVKLTSEKVDPKFAFYYFQAKFKQFIEKVAVSATVKSIRKPMLTRFPIPVAPLEIQREIVRMLDVFNDLERNLASELKLRRKQFAQIRSAFVNSAGRPMVPLESISRNLDNQRVPISQRDRVAGDIPYYGASGIVDYVADYIFDGDYLLISEDGANLRTRVSPIAFSITGKTWVNNHAHVLEFDSYYVRKFVEHYINDIDLSAFVSGGAQPKLNQRNLNSIPIPVFTDAELKSVVNKLDALEALIRAIEDEIALRRKQYGYYRDELFILVQRKA